MPFVWLSSSPKSREGIRRKDEAATMTYKLREKRMTMAPSRGCDWFANDESAFIGSSSCRMKHKTSLPSSSTFPLDARNTGGSRVSNVSQANPRVPRLDEPFLYDIPADLNPLYQTPPLLLRLVIWASSALLAGREFISQVVSAASVSQITCSIREQAPATLARKVAAYFLRYLLFATIAKLSIQERFFAPSRVSTKYLVDNDQLPSELSRYETISPRSTWGETREVHEEIGVHSIQYTKSVEEKQEDGEPLPKFDGIFLHHGFGASSLSWIPVLPSLVDKLGKGGAVGIASDNPGFGFSDRPDGDTDAGLAQYSSEGNAGIALSLLDRHVSQEKDDKSRSVAIFGHSMGSKAALLMALTCVKEPRLKLKPSLLVLVAPALEGLALPARKSSTTKSKSSQTNRGWLRSKLSLIRVLLRKVFLDYPIQFGLRRLVGRAGFWRKGLELAWGSGHLSDSDVLRFQWPSIGSGWEQGLINFSRSKLFSKSVLDDIQLLREITRHDETTVVIVYGSKDRVVPIEGSVAEEIRRSFPSIRLIRMEDLGHDPFEEDVPGFISELEKSLLQ
mmetsp:Transcript_32326/g.77275  ORF Transcript_32326/g.77275 Transcript_32326/m.77275 type:complete len:563 (+) Transcript_32326:179-1867(+)